MNDVEYTAALTHDAQEHAAGLHAWEQHYEQLSPGRFEGRMEDLWLGGVQVFRESSCQAVLQSGRPRPQSFTVALTQARFGPGWFCGHPLDEGRAIAISSSGEFEFVTSPGMELLAVSVDIAQLEQAAQRLHGPAAELVLPQVCVLENLARSQAELQELLGSAMQLAKDHPSLLGQPALRRTLSQAMTELVLDCVKTESRRTALAAGAAAHRRIVRAARDYMQAHAEEAITVPDLCTAVGCSRRSLQYAFEEVLRTSPVTYLRIMRLNRVRRDLLARRGGAVGDVAARWGFWHLSRFAADYRAMFGELPSATLNGLLSAALSRPTSPSP